MPNQHRDKQPIAFDPLMYQEQNKDISYSQLAGKVIDNQRPTNDNQYMFGYVLICITLLIAFKMHLNHKSGSPSAKAERDLKLDLINEMSLFKDTLNNETVKRNRFVDSRLNELNLSISSVNQATNYNTDAIHELQKDNKDMFSQILNAINNKNT